jgi:hypothetical protein
MAIALRIGLLILSASLALWISWGIPALKGLAYVRDGGYYFLCAAAVALFVLSLKAIFSCHIWHWKSLAMPLGMIGIASFFLIHQNESRFQVLFDEPSIAATAVGMHCERKVCIPNHAHTIEGGSYWILKTSIDKRPPAMAFLICLLHDLTGFRFENNFWVNRILIPIALGLCFSLGFGLSGLIGGYSAIFLATSLPLLGWCTNSCGMEVLFITLILALWRVAIAYAKTLSSLHLGLILCLLIGLSQTRYEGLLWALPAGLMVAWGWVAHRRMHWPIGFSFSPVLFTPTLWHHRIFEVEPLLWELQSKGVDGSPFGWQFFHENAGSALNFLFGWTPYLPNSLILSVLGLICTFLFIVWSMKRIRQFFQGSAEVAALKIFTFGCLLCWGMTLTYFWGQLDDTVVMRLGLPMLIGFIFPIVFCLWGPDGLLRRLRHGITLWGCACAGSFLAWSCPRIAQHPWSSSNRLAQEAQMVQSFAKSLPDGETALIMTEVPIFWSSLRKDVIPIAKAVERKPQLQFYLSLPHKPKIYIQEWFYHASEGDIRTLERLKTPSRIPEEKDFETVLVKRFYSTPLSGIQFSELKKVHGLEPLKIDGIEPLKVQSLKEIYANYP